VSTPLCPPLNEALPEDNQQTLQQESATELATVVPISYHSRGFSTGPL